MKRILPAIGLFFIAPLVAEFLLGNMSISLLGSLIVLAPWYGGGALLVREIVRRSGRGWPSILILGVAFGVLEEAFMTQSLFNPDYLGLNLHLLQPAFVPALGIGIWWTLFVLTLHAVWSISVSIGLTEALVPDRATKPWLGWIGFAVVCILFVLAAVATSQYTIQHDAHHFVASSRQFIASAVVFFVLVIVAFVLPKARRPRSAGTVPNPWLVGFLALLAGSIFLLFPGLWGWWAVAVYLCLYTAMIVSVHMWSVRTAWDARHRLALVAGAALAYAWHAFMQNPSVGAAGSVARIGNVIFAVVAIALIAVAGRNTSAFERAQSAGLQSSASTVR